MSERRGLFEDLLDEIRRNQRGPLDSAPGRSYEYLGGQLGGQAQGPAITRGQFLAFCASAAGCLLLAKVCREAPSLNRFYEQPFQDTFWVLADPESGEIRVVDRVAYDRHAGALMVLGVMKVTRGNGSLRPMRVSDSPPWMVFDFKPTERVQ